ALARLRCIGVKNNMAWLRRLCLQPEFAAGGYDTGLLDRIGQGPAGSSRVAPIDPETMKALAGLARWAVQARLAPRNSSDPLSRLDGFYSGTPVYRQDNWQAGGPGEAAGQLTSHTHVRLQGSSATVQSPGHQLLCRLSEHTASNGLPRLTGEIINGPHAGNCFDLVWQGDQLHLFVGEEQALLLWNNPANIRAGLDTEAHGVAAPMPGRVFAVFVKVGDRVTKGQPLIGLEAMKMEHTLNSPCDGVIQAIPHPVGEQVTEGTELVHFQEDEA
ncbi:MAG TPA: biotin/lipoyl-containing protein, partial [Limnobacter sp.]|nr:biotin/lipoyl-containing protein [Limnobacter sp.]